MGSFRKASRLHLLNVIICAHITQDIFLDRHVTVSIATVLLIFTVCLILFQLKGDKARSFLLRSGRDERLSPVSFSVLPKVELEQALRVRVIPSLYGSFIDYKSLRHMEVEAYGYAIEVAVFLGAEVRHSRWLHGGVLGLECRLLDPWLVHSIC